MSSLELRQEVAQTGDEPLAGCPPDRAKGSKFDERYALEGVQVEPSAAWWLTGKALPRPGSIERIRTLVGVPDHFFKSDEELKSDLATLRGQYVNVRQKPFSEIGYVLSDFINLQKPPFGAVFNTDGTQYAVSNVNNQEERIDPSKFKPNIVTTGEQLARLFENETPGLYHRHLLNWFFYNRPDVSPIRQARIWMALDMAIYTALSAAWYYKWGYGPEHTGNKLVSFRIRPYEYTRDPALVLFDSKVRNDGNGSGTPRGMPCPSPGTPRHPTFPSGHSTYSAAASRVLEYFFSPQTLQAKDAEVISNEPKGPDRFGTRQYLASQLRKLRNNIGEARLFAGVHWPTDHKFGQRVGAAAADSIIEQLRADCIPAYLAMEANVPDDERMLDLKRLRESPCPASDPLQDNHDTIPSRSEKPDLTAVQF